MKIQLAARFDYEQENVLLILGFNDVTYRVDFNQESVGVSKKDMKLINLM